MRPLIPGKHQRKRKPPRGGKCVESLNGPERGTKLITFDKSVQPYAHIHSTHILSNWLWTELTDPR